MSGTKAWCSKLLPLQGLLVALVAVGIYPSWGFAEHGDTEIRKNFLTSKLTFNQKPDLGKPVTVTYTIQATADGLQDLEIHLEVGRVYVNSGMGPVRHDVVMVGNGTQQTRTISLPSLRKGESYSTTFMVQIPNVSLKDLKRVMAYPIEAPAIAAVWTSYKLPDGRPSYVCSWGELNGRVEVGPFLWYEGKGNFMASYFRDTDEKPNEANKYLHYWGPQDGDHEADVDLEWIRNLENVRNGLDLPNELDSRVVSVHLWDYVERTQKKESLGQASIISRMSGELNQIASQKRLSKFEAAREFLRAHAVSYPKLKSQGPSVNQTYMTTHIVGHWWYDRHHYDTTGLYDDDADTLNPIRKAQVIIWDFGNDSVGRSEMAGAGFTDANGAFDIAADLVYWPGQRNNIQIILKYRGINSDSLYYEQAVYKDSLFTDWYLHKVQINKGNIHVGQADTFDNLHPNRAYEGGVRYKYPISGVANIWDVGYRAHTLIESFATIYPPYLKFIWNRYVLNGGTRTVWDSPNSIAWIFLSGDTTGPSYNDEWNNDMIGHEYGHFLMFKLAEYPPKSMAGTHHWYAAYPDSPGTALCEGWANYFGCWLHSGLANVIDSLYIDTKGGIGNHGYSYWRDIETPTKFSGSGTWEGGPWCEGAVSGFLWDIYDNHNEYFPDSLADSIGVSLYPELDAYVWDDFQHYTTTRASPDSAHKNYSAYDFLSGWMHSYWWSQSNRTFDHEEAVREIAKRQGIIWDPPSAPTGLADTVYGDSVHLVWNRCPDGNRWGYNIYHKPSGLVVGYERINAFVNSDPDTTFNAVYDSYWPQLYSVTALDTLRRESDLCSWLQVGSSGGGDQSGKAVSVLPKVFNLAQNAPNGFSDHTDILYALPKAAHTSLKVYNLNGELVKTLVDEVKKPGFYQVQWKGTDSRDRRVASGVYFYRMEAGQYTKTLKMVVVR